MQENVMQFFNTLPLFIGIAISFTFSFNEDTSIKVPILLVIISTVISFLLPIFNLKSWVTYSVIVSESAMFVLIAILLSKKIKNVVSVDFRMDCRICLGSCFICFDRTGF